MNEGSARVRLEAMTAASVEPTLTEDELDQLLDMARRPDVFGALPSDTDWEPTWNLDYAAAVGWHWKAGKVTANFDFSTDGQSFQRSQVWQHCDAMRRYYARRGGLGSIPTHRFDDLSALEVLGNL